MATVAWNFHFMMNRHPGPGGVYDYATKAFGADHGFLCGWFLGLAYIAIVWMDATVISFIGSFFTRGRETSAFGFGFRYAIEGYSVRFDHIALSVVVIAAVAAICSRRRLAGAVQTVLSVAFVAGILVFAGAAVCRHGTAPAGPAFAPGDVPRLVQVLGVVGLMPWLFIGFESVSNLSGEFRFPLRKSFGVMLCAIAFVAAAYALLTLIPVLAPGFAPGGGFAGWREAVDSILVSGKTLLGLVNDILDLSKLESGRMEIVPEPTDCPRILREVMDSFRVSRNRAGVELRCRFGAMPTLMADPQRLRQIAFNLVGNAVKFTEKGHVELRAFYDRKEGADAGTLRLEVEDTGCGISEEDLKRIGRDYVQVGPLSSKRTGTGLGLAICRQLTASVGGGFAVESALGRGSTFTITLPGIQPAPAGAAPGGEPAAASPAPVPAAPGDKARRLLLVDGVLLKPVTLGAVSEVLAEVLSPTRPKG